MRVIGQQNILQRQSVNYIAGELSNVAAVVQTPQIFADYFSIDQDASPRMDGFKNIEDFIGPESPVIYNEVEDLPMSGADNLVTQAEFDQELGFDEDLQSGAIIFPNTIIPKPNEFFTLPSSQVTALYVVTGVSPVTVRDNPFVEIQFRLYSRDPELIKALRRQVRDHYVTTVTAIGTDRSLVIKKESYLTIQDHVKNYMDLADLYKTLFYDRTRSAFIFDGIYDEASGEKKMFLDITLWRLMFDERIVVYDDVVTYAINNLNRRDVDQIYISCPDIFLDDYTYRRSILYRLYTQDRKHRFDEYKYPQSYEPDPQMGKYKGKNLVYFEQYGDSCDCNPMCMTCPLWDQEFVDRIRENVPYKETEDYVLHDGIFDEMRTTYDNGVMVSHYNPILRNAIISWYNGETINWDDLIIEEKRTCENYFLIPLVLAAYKSYIHDLQK